MTTKSTDAGPGRGTAEGNTGKLTRVSTPSSLSLVLEAAQKFAPHSVEVAGNALLCAWATSEASCRIQTTDPEISKALRKLPDCRLAGYSVEGAWIRVFAMPYALPWV